MSEQHEQAGELYESEEVFDVVFPSRDQSAVVLHPGKDPLDLPAAAIATQRTAVLGLPLTVDAVGRDHFDAVFTHLLVECIRVVGLVADQSRG